MKRFLLFLLLGAAAVLPAWSAIRGDVTGDGKVDISDVNAAINIILETKTVDDYPGTADIVGNDNKVDVSDVNAIINIILNEGSQLSDMIYTVNGVSFKMIAVEGGTFTMGATAEQGNDYYSDELPTHQVTLSSYNIGETEVTQELWVAVMGSNPSRFTGSNGYAENLQRPVENVSWNDCQTFITKLNQLTGKTFRLPTEAEWEYAARGGNKSQGYKYAGSNNIDEVAWYWDNIPSQTLGTAGYGTQTIATKAPNELGLYDMSGNVWEWCQDLYGDYSSDAQTNPTGPTVGSDRLPRGGGWSSGARYCRVSKREVYFASSKLQHLGLRLAL